MASELQPLPLNTFSPGLQRHVDPASPPPFRLMGAKGLAPAAPHETLALLYQLSFDADGPIRGAARETATGLPDDLLLAGLAGEVPPPVIAWFLGLRRHAAPVLERIITHAATPDETVAEIARTCSEALTELIGENEVRVLRHPAIIEALYLNENARTSRIDRLLDLARRNNVRFEGLPALQVLLEDDRYDTAAAAQQSASKEDALRARLEASRMEEAEREIEEQGLTEEQRTRKRVKEQEDESEDNGRVKNRAAAILSMSISEKMRLATLGSAGDRDLLIKEANRLVHMAAVTSPKVQLRDIVAWSSNKQLPDNVISYIANHARYRRVYQITVNLVNNPKTPLKETVRLIPMLHDKDLQMLMRNRNVSGTVRRQAQALKEQKERKR